MVYPHKLVDIGGSWFQPHCDFDGFSTSTCDMASVSRGNPSSTQRLHCRAMSFKDLVMQGTRNTHSTGMCKVLVKYIDIEPDFLHEVARNGVRSYVSLRLDPFNPFTTQ